MDIILQMDLILSMLSLRWTMKLCLCGWLGIINDAHIVIFLSLVWPVNHIKTFERIKFILLNKSQQNTRT